MRRKPPGRLTDIAEAAINVFTRQGYRRSQVADIAAALGVSVGSLYSYATGKEALAQLALLRLLEQPMDALPMPFEASPAMEALVRQRIAERADWPLLRAALGKRPVAPAGAELGALVGELYDMTLRQRRLIRFLDACALQLPALAQQFVEQTKLRYIQDFERYLALRQRYGRLRAVGPVPAGSARALIELVAWLSLHRQGDAVPPPLDDDQARATAIAFAIAAFQA